VRPGAPLSARRAKPVGLTVSKARLGWAWKQFVEQELERSCPVYEAVAQHFLSDDVLLRRLTELELTTPGRFLAAVRFCALAGAEFPGAEQFRAGAAELPDAEWTGIRQFVLDNAVRLAQMASQRGIQVNEVSRCACLLPALIEVGQAEIGRPLHLIEVGASAGLNLLLDSYGYTYPGQQWGPRDCPVQINVPLRSGALPQLSTMALNICSRLGVDLYPIALDNPDDTLWLEAQVWPDHHARVNLLRNALVLARQRRPEVRRGDMFSLTPELVRAAPSDARICVVHTFVLTHFTPEQRQR
jgi:hypothetical protein